MSTAAITASYSYSAVAQFLTDRPSNSTPTPGSRTNGTESSGPTSGNPTDSIDLSDQAKAILSQIQNGQTLANQLQEQVHTNKNSSASATAPSANQSEAGAGGEVAIIVAKSISLTAVSDISNASSLSVGTETSSTSLVQNVQTSKGSYQIYLQNDGIDTPFGRALGL